MSNRRVSFSDYFTRAFKRLRKTYPQIGNDLNVLIEQLKGGETPGDQVPGIGHTVFKVRIQNRSARSGKRGGFRVLYYLQTADAIFLITVYSKTERENISANELRRLIEEVDDI